MSDAHGATLYATLDQSRFFHVPMDATIPEGGLPVRTLSGGRMDLDQQALEAYEVDEARAKEIVRDQLGSFMEFAGQAIGQLQSLATRFQEARNQMQEMAGTESSATRKTHIADALRIDPEKVDDPAQVMRGLNAIMERVQARMADPDAMKQSGTRDAIRDDIRRMETAATESAAIDAERAVEDARAALLEIFGSDETREALRGATDELRRVRQEMQQANVVGQTAPGPTGNRPAPDAEE